MSYLPDYVDELPEGHPVKVYCQENILIGDIVLALENTSMGSEPLKFISLFNQLSTVEIHYTRKENQLFPYLEKRGWNGPSQGMWTFHDQIREMLRGARKNLENKDYKQLEHDMPMILSEIMRLVQVEEMRLFPNALQLLNLKDWQDMSVGEEEIGWMLEKKPAKFSQAQDTNLIDIEPEQSKDSSIVPQGFIPLDEGHMTPEQINLLLRFLPIDITYVDENDRVVFYNRGELRVFPRSAGVIGREVRFCHPPKSVGTVLKIVEGFKAGAQSEAEFWIRSKGRFLHIRYFAIRDKEGVYKGVVEMSQDITDIQKLEGEQRLLSWES